MHSLICDAGQNARLKSLLRKAQNDITHLERLSQEDNARFDKLGEQNRAMAEECRRLCNQLVELTEARPMHASEARMLDQAMDGDEDYDEDDEEHEEDELEDELGVGNEKQMDQMEYTANGPRGHGRKMTRDLEEDADAEEAERPSRALDTAQSMDVLEDDQDMDEVRPP